MSLGGGGIGLDWKREFSLVRIGNNQAGSWLDFTCRYGLGRHNPGSGVLRAFIFKLCLIGNVYIIVCAECLKLEMDSLYR
jgi:hypothetical protein